MVMKDLKYEYFLKVWGGFFNPTNIEIHGITQQTYYFDTKHERDFKLKQLEEWVHRLKDMGIKDGILCNVTAEGYNTRRVPVLHRVSEYKGIRYHSKLEWAWPEGFDTLKYHLEYKWTPGFNDDVVQDNVEEDVDWDKVVVIYEWIEGPVMLEERR
jgi:hypothetical protein